MNNLHYRRLPHLRLHQLQGQGGIFTATDALGLHDRRLPHVHRSAAVTSHITPGRLYRAHTYSTFLAQQLRRIAQPSYSMSNADFLGRAIETVKKAIETDTAGEYEKAYQLYYSARKSL